MRPLGSLRIEVIQGPISIPSHFLLAPGFSPALSSRCARVKLSESAGYRRPCNSNGDGS